MLQLYNTKRVGQRASVDKGIQEIYGMQKTDKANWRKQQPLLYHTCRGISLQSPYSETVDTKEVRNELCNKTERFIKSLLVGEGPELGTIKEKLPVSVSSRHFRTSGIKRIWKEIERGTTK